MLGILCVDKRMVRIILGSVLVGARLEMLFRRTLVLRGLQWELRYRHPELVVMTFADPRVRQLGALLVRVKRIMSWVSNQQ
jgi:hypothetical protein